MNVFTCNHLPVVSSTSTAKKTALSESRSYQMATTSTYLSDMEPCSVWEAAGRGCRVETGALRLWPSSFPGLAHWITPCTMDWMCLMSLGRILPKQKNLWTQWSHLESSLRLFTVPASTRDETAALSYQ